MGSARGYNGSDDRGPGKGCSMAVSAQTTQILIDLSNGEPSAAGRLLPLIYDELRALAGRYMEQERADHTLQATALVHEAYLKLIDQSRVDWKNRAHFFAAAAVSKFFLSKMSVWIVVCLAMASLDTLSFLLPITALTPPPTFMVFSDLRSNSDGGAMRARNTVG